MKKVIVIGGGFAGLSAAVHLASRDISVELLEASPKLGGRAYSFPNKNNQTIIDNGQHILMGCYTETLNFFNLIGAEDNLIRQNQLEINFLKPGFEIIKLKAGSLPHPFNLLLGLLTYKALNFRERLLIARFILKLNKFAHRNIEKLTVHEWLQKENQNENIQKAFWEVLAVGTLNTNIRKASAKIFSDVIKEIFLTDRNFSTIILPKKGLSETYCVPAQNYLEQRNCSIHLSHQVEGFTISNGVITEIITDKGKILDFDGVISSVPLHSMEKFISADYLNIKPELEYSSILSIHIWLKSNQLKEQFYGLINSPLHWIFNKGTHLTLVISDADYLMDKLKDEIFNIVLSEIKLYTPIREEHITDYQIIKEKRATFVPSVGILNSRPSVITGLDNFFAAGDWLDTGLPSTIESAVKSGKLACEAILNSSYFKNVSTK